MVDTQRTIAVKWQFTDTHTQIFISLSTHSPFCNVFALLTSPPLGKKKKIGWYYDKNGHFSTSNCIHMYTHSLVDIYNKPNKLSVCVCVYSPNPILFFSSQNQTFFTLPCLFVQQFQISRCFPESQPPPPPHTSIYLVLTSNKSISHRRWINDC